MTTLTRQWAPARRWPTLAAIAFAALTAHDLATGVDLAQIIAASAMIYLGAAALGRQSVAWPLFFGTFIIITVAKIAGLDSTAVLLVLAVPVAVYAVIKHRDITVQGLAMLAFGAVALTALVVNEQLGAYLVAAGLLGHTAWDIYHLRANRVVSQSLAEFCAVLDTLLALAVIVTELT
ncbi:hypothetical protein [Nocardia sp. XZ_19_385]|uniref:hypothetical protein n=1 Tax=Nocardia sp. XZ_19_385 TaxID=2769488 RepID=UPI00188DDA4F|nr:hypothetical protein [Nocardia sp. XZ_19_385]